MSILHFLNKLYCKSQSAINSRGSEPPKRPPLSLGFKMSTNWSIIGKILTEILKCHEKY